MATSEGGGMEIEEVAEAFAREDPGRFCRSERAGCAIRRPELVIGIGIPAAAP